MKGVVKIFRLAGMLALLALAYGWMHPARLGKWLGGTPPPAAVQPAPAPLRAASTAPESAAADNAADVPAAWKTIASTPPPARGSTPQIAMARWLGSKYRTAPAFIETLIIEADKLSAAYRLSPNLLIAVMAIESNFHPYIQSEAGAQGLMQVMPRIHARRYEKFGGASSFIDPLVSLKVGAEILRDCVKLKDGSETEALRFYFGGGPSSDNYIDKVRAEQQRLNLVAAGRPLAVE